MKKEIRIVDGQAVEATICPPSRRRAPSRIAKIRLQRISKAAMWIAKDNGQIKEKE